MCVAVFTLLSGYGLAVSYQKTKESFLKFTVRHLAGLMKRFWLIYLLFFVGAVFLARPEYTPSAVYGSGINGGVRALLDFLSLRPLFNTATLNQTWWYMEAALVLYLLFPVLFWFIKKAPWISLPVTAVPLILYFVFGNNIWDTCREIYWLFPFAAGIFIAQHDLLSRVCSVLEKKRLITTLLSIAALIVTALCRAKIGLAFDTFFAVSIVIFCRAVFCSIPYLSKVFAYIGRHSSDIFMTHSFIYCYFISQKLFIKLLWSQNFVVQFSAFPLLLILSLLCSVVLEAIRKTMKRIS